MSDEKGENLLESVVSKNGDPYSDHHDLLQKRSNVHSVRDLSLYEMLWINDLGYQLRKFKVDNEPLLAEYIYEPQNNNDLDLTLNDSMYDLCFFSFFIQEPKV